MASPLQTTCYRVPVSEFTGQTYDVPLEHVLLANHLVTVTLATQDTAGRTDEADEHFCHAETALAGDAVIRLARDKAVPVSALEIVITVMECSTPGHAEGFTLRGTFELVFGTGDSTITAAHSGVVDPDQCQVVFGGSKSDATAGFQKTVGLPRLRHTATDVEASRISTGKTLTVTAYLIEWGSSVVVDLVEFTSATMTEGTDLATGADWETVAVTSVVSAETFLSSTFTTKTSATPGNYPESLVCVLGDGLTVGTNEAEVAVGSWKGGVQTDGWIYLVSCPAWAVERFLEAHGTFVDFNTLSAQLAVSPPSGTETYTLVSSVERCIGNRLVRTNQTCDYLNTSEYYLPQHNAILTSASVLDYSRAIGGPTPRGKGTFAVEIVDFDGSAAGDPNDISGSTSTVEISQAHSIVADGEMPTTVTVTVLDSTSKFIPGATVKLKVGAGAFASTVASPAGVAVFEVTSQVIGVAVLTVLMGTSEVAIVSPPSITFEAKPEHWDLTDKPAVNIGLIAEFAENQPFLDLMKTSKVVIGVRFGTFDVQAKQSFNDEGYQVDCALDEQVAFIITQAGRGSWKPGSYVITYGFEGGSEWAGFNVSEVTLSGATVKNHTITAGVGRIEFTWDALQDLQLTVRPSVVMTSSNFFRDPRCLEESVEPTYDPNVNIWRQSFLDRLAPFKELRFMDFTQTNNSWQQAWADRPGPQSFTTRRYIYDDDFPTVRRYLGAPWEMAIELSNRLKKDAHINVPDLAVDDYGTQLATLWRNGHDPDRMVKIEFSNELWNPGFIQAARRDLLLTKYSLSDTSANRLAATAIRSCEIFKLFEAVYVDDQHRFKRIIAGQAGNPSTPTSMLTADLSLSSEFSSGIAADKVGPFHGMFSIAPYVGNNVEESTAQAAFDAMLVDFETKFDPATGDVVIGIANARVVRSDIRFDCYEAGQHLSSGGVMTDLVVQEANRLSAFRAWVKVYCERISQVTGGCAISWFSDCFDDTNGNAWGLLNTPDALTSDDESGRVKYLGYLDWAASLEIGSETMTTTLKKLIAHRTKEIGSGDMDHCYGDFARDGSLRYCHAFQHKDGGGKFSIYARVFTPVFDLNSATPDVPVDYDKGNLISISAAANANFNSGNNESKRPEVVGLDDGSFVISYAMKKTDGSIHDANSCVISVKKLDPKENLIEQANGLGQIIDGTVTLGTSDGFSRMVSEPNGRFTILYIHEASFVFTTPDTFRTFDLRMSSWTWPLGSAAPVSKVAETTVVTAFKIDDSLSQPWATDSAAVGLFDIAVAPNGDYHIAYERADSSQAQAARTRIEYARLASGLYATPFAVVDSADFSNGAGGADQDRPQRRPRISTRHPWEAGPFDKDRFALVWGDQHIGTPEDSTYLYLTGISGDNGALTTSPVTPIANTGIDGDNESVGKVDCAMRPSGVGLAFMALSNEAGIGGSRVRLHDSEGAYQELPLGFISVTRPHGVILRLDATSYLLAVAFEGNDERGGETEVGVVFYVG